MGEVTELRAEFPHPGWGSTQDSRSHLGRERVSGCFHPALGREWVKQRNWIFGDVPGYGCVWKFYAPKIQFIISFPINHCQKMGGGGVNQSFLDTFGQSRMCFCTHRISQTPLSFKDISNCSQLRPALNVSSVTPEMIMAKAGRRYC